MRTIREIELSGKKVFIRSDMNVPFDEAGAISDDHRIRASLPTISLALEKGAAVIVCSHLGQPKGKVVDSLSMRPVATRVAELLGVAVQFASDCVGAEAEKLAQALTPGQVLVLENTRFHKEEEANDPTFSKQLASLAEVYINDAFASNHRAHASTCGMAQHFKEKAAGLTLAMEMEFFARALKEPERPLAAIFGGAKVSSKMKAIKNVAKQANMVVVGGAMANTFFVAQGLTVGKSLFEPEQVAEAKAAMHALEALGCKLVLPVDVLVADSLKEGAATKVVAIDSIPDDMLAVDIGPDSVKLIKESLAAAKTIIWNGPMGAFEIPAFSEGTFGVVGILAESSALTVVGGGDTDLALHQCHAMEKMDYVSTGGGAFLELLEGRLLPGVEALG
jgi:phosphoglycerate kinase